MGVVTSLTDVASQAASLSGAVDALTAARRGIGRAAARDASIKPECEEIDRLIVEAVETATRALVVLDARLEQMSENA